MNLAPFVCKLEPRTRRAPADDIRDSLPDKNKIYHKIKNFSNENILSASVNPLDAEFYKPFRGMEIIFTNLHLTLLFFQCLLFGTDFFFGTHVSQAEN